MRALLVGLVVLAGARALRAEPPFTSAEGKYSIKFPGPPKTTEKTAKSDLGELTVSLATYAHSNGSVFLAGYTDYPANAVTPDKQAAFFDTIREGASKGGKLVGKEKELTIGDEKWPGREFTVEKDRGKQRIRFRVFLRDRRLYQLTVLGTPDFVTGRDANAFFDSLELTK